MVQHSRLQRALRKIQELEGGVLVVPAAAPVEAVQDDGEPPAKLPPKKRPRKQSKKREKAAEDKDFDAFCAATTPGDLAKLNEHSNGVQTIFSLSGYRAFHRWRAAEVAAIDARASSNSLAALEAHGRAQAGEIDAEAFSAPSRRRSRTPRELRLRLGRVLNVLLRRGLGLLPRRPILANGSVARHASVCM